VAITTESNVKVVGSGLEDRLASLTLSERSTGVRQLTSGLATFAQELFTVKIEEEKEEKLLSQGEQQSVVLVMYCKLCALCVYYGFRVAELHCTLI